MRTEFIKFSRAKHRDLNGCLICHYCFNYGEYSCFEKKLMNFLV